MLKIKKKSGIKENFSQDKLRISLKYAGASEELARKIAQEVEAKCISGTSTYKIYALAFTRLKKISRTLASHYSIRKALLELGPDGYLFEVFIASLFESKGFKIELNQIKKGKCVNHEVDVIASKRDIKNFVECKFHNRQGTKNDLKVALYVKARSDDLFLNKENKLTSFWLISNTKFSKDAIDFAECSGLKLLGPTYPLTNSLLNWIKETRNHPISCLTRLKKGDLKKVLSHKIVNTDQLIKERVLLENIGLSKEQIDLIFEEIKNLRKVVI